MRDCACAGRLDFSTVTFSVNLFNIYLFIYFVFIFIFIGYFASFGTCTRNAEFVTWNFTTKKKINHNLGCVCVCTRASLCLRVCVSVRMRAEEIFSTPEAIWSSADGSHIMFASFNDTQVGTMVYPWFDSGAVMAVQSISSTSFPETRTIRYPTPGSRNPEVQLWIANVSNTNALRIWPVKPPITLDGQWVQHDRFEAFTFNFQPFSGDDGGKNLHKFLLKWRKKNNCYVQLRPDLAWCPLEIAMTRERNPNELVRKNQSKPMLTVFTTRTFLRKVPQLFAPKLLWLENWTVGSERIINYLLWLCAQALLNAHVCLCFYFGETQHPYLSENGIR